MQGFLVYDHNQPALEINLSPDDIICHGWGSGVLFVTFNPVECDVLPILLVIADAPWHTSAYMAIHHKFRHKLAKELIYLYSMLDRDECGKRE